MTPISDDMVERGAARLAELELGHGIWPKLGDTHKLMFTFAFQNALTAALEGSVAVPVSALMWLHGEGPDPDGKWFGELEDDVERMPRKHTPRYWWRTKFRKLIPDWSALPRQQRGGEAQ